MTLIEPKLADDALAADIEAAADVVVWAVDRSTNAMAIPPGRPQDKTHVGNILETIIAYAKGELGDTPIHLDDVDHMIVIGSDRMMAAVKEARHGVLKPYLKQKHHAIGSINSPMQCMMKGVCAQCLCKHVDPNTGEEFFVYLERALRAPAPPTLMLQLFLFCLRAGFCGRYAQLDDPQRMAYVDEHREGIVTRARNGAEIRIHIYRSAGEWFGARWIDGEYDVCDSLDIDDEATTEQAIDAAMAMPLAVEGMRSVVRVADVGSSS